MLRFSILAVVIALSESVAVPTPTISPATVIVGCDNARNQPVSTRQSTLLQCQELMNWALYLANHESSCNFRSQGAACYNTTDVGKCDSWYNVKVNSLYLEFTYGSYRVVASNGVPLHDYRTGAKQNIPNYVCEHYKVMLLPLKPYRAPATYDTWMGALGISLTGGFIFNHKSAEAQCNAAAISEAATFDTAGGHASPSCDYHYHLTPTATVAGLKDCQVAGYMIDGYPIYTQNCQNARSCYELKDPTKNTNTTVTTSTGRVVTIFNGCDSGDYTFNSAKLSAKLCDLDDANGKWIDSNNYAYFFTPNYPYLMPKLAGYPYYMCPISL